MITRLVPTSVSAAQAYEPEWEWDLLPEELVLVHGAVETRRRQFAAARACARRALARLGQPHCPILNGENREPLWPPGVVGSITHSGGYCAAAVATSSELAGLGIDAEANAPLFEGVLQLTCTANEMRRLIEIPDVQVPALIFSAKESLYKAWYSLARRWLNYLDAEIDFDVATAAFSVRLLSTAPVDALLEPTTFSGRFAATRQHVFTVVTANHS